MRIIVYITFFILCVGCKRKYQVNVLCNNIDYVKKGDLVKHLGIKIGEVEDYAIIHNEAVINLSILEKYKIPIKSLFFIKNEDLFGNKFIDVIYSDYKTYINDKDTLHINIDTGLKKEISIDSATFRNIDTLIKLFTKEIEKFQPQQKKNY
jgi:ABC-type transporter Mla subunit MlaD